MPLTDARIRNAKPDAKPAKLSDGGGLHLLVTAGGSKLWRLAYRFGGKQKTLALGSYPAVSLEKARAGRAEAKRQLADGTDPGEVRRIERLRQRVAAENTFEAIAGEWLDKQQREARAPATLQKQQWLLSLARDRLGRRPIAAISSAEVLEVLRQTETSGRLETARRLRSTIGSVIRFAIATGRAENDPTTALRGAVAAPTVTHRAAITDPVALGALLRAIDGLDGQPTTRAGLQLMALLFPRPGELRGAHWSELDLDAGIWSVPAARMKMRRAHRVPLSRQAVAVLRELHDVTGRGRLAFPSLRSAHRPMSDNTINAALRRMGYAKDEATAHGFRATASTLLNESGQWPVDVIERQLAHVDANAVRRAYARGDHWPERVRMMQWWADRLDEWKAG